MAIIGNHVLPRLNIGHMGTGVAPPAAVPTPAAPTHIGPGSGNTPLGTPNPPTPGASQ